MEADRYESLLRSGAEVIEHSRALRRLTEELREESRAIAASARDVATTARAVVADSKLVIDLLLDHVLCDRCLTQRAEVPRTRFFTVWDELTRRFTSATTLAATCDDCGEQATLHRLY